MPGMSGGEGLWGARAVCVGQFGGTDALWHPQVGAWAPWAALCQPGSAAGAGLALRISPHIPGIGTSEQPSPRAGAGLVLDPTAPSSLL